MPTGAGAEAVRCGKHQPTQPVAEDVGAEIRRYNRGNRRRGDYDRHLPGHPNTLREGRPRLDSYVSFIKPSYLTDSSQASLGAWSLEHGAWSYES